MHSMGHVKLITLWCIDVCIYQVEYSSASGFVSRACFAVSSAKNLHSGDEWESEEREEGRKR